jgi:hypothetical protein
MVVRINNEFKYEVYSIEIVKYIKNITKHIINRNNIFHNYTWTGEC